MDSVMLTVSHRCTLRAALFALSWQQVLTTCSCVSCGSSKGMSLSTCSRQDSTDSLSRRSFSLRNTGLVPFVTFSVSFRAYEPGFVGDVASPTMFSIVTEMSLLMSLATLDETRSATNSTIFLTDCGCMWKKFSSSWRSNRFAAPVVLSSTSRAETGVILRTSPPYRDLFPARCSASRHRSSPR
uniref:Putative secreted protein n=1 Tax=Ixodes ricinus TaxID=34613 RepID=A0A6B0V1U2_IXORI